MPTDTTTGSPPDDDGGQGVRPFAAFLQETRGGALHAELSEGLAELVHACLEHEGAGSLTLKIRVAPNRDGLSVTVTDDVAIKAPQGDRGAALFFADRRGNLSRRNPAQPELPLREITTTTPEPRVLPNDDGRTAREASA